jgi:hypothetical protein
MLDEANPGLMEGRMMGRNVNSGQPKTTIQIPAPPPKDKKHCLTPEELALSAGGASARTVEEMRRIRRGK